MKAYRFGIITSHMSEGFLAEKEQVTVETPWGAATVYCGKLEGIPCAVLLRYGDKSTVASHRISFRANLWALKTLGVEHLITQNAIGSVNPDIRPGDFVIPDDFIDFTKHRELSFFEEEECWVRVDMTDPFCPALRQKLISAAKEIGVNPRERGVFICTEGPRFETPAEVRFYRSIGGDIIGTPMVPEAVLAREAGICYASVSIVINMATGMAPAVVHSGDEGIINYYARTGLEEKVEQIFRLVAKSLDTPRTCHCAQALEEGIHGTPPVWANGVLLHEAEK